MAIKIPPQSSGWLAWREREIYMTGEEANEQVRMATPKFTFGSSYLRALRVDRPEDYWLYYRVGKVGIDILSIRHTLMNIDSPCKL